VKPGGQRGGLEWWLKEGEGEMRVRRGGSAQGVGGGEGIWGREG